MSAFWAWWTPYYICWVRHVLTLALLFKSLEKSRMGTRLLEFGGIRLVINQSIVPMDWSLHLKIGVSFRCLLSKVISFILVRYILSIVFDITLICSYMWDLTSGLTYGAYLVLFLKLGATNCNTLKIAPFEIKRN